MDEIDLGQEGQVPENAEPQQNDVEQRALEMGWRPKEQFNGDEHEFIDAGEFVRRKPLFDKIEQLSKRSKETEKALRLLQEHHTKVEETAKKQVIAELKAQKKNALEEGDAEKVIEIDDQIAQFRAAEAVETKAPQAPNGPPQEFINWVERNKWYTQDTEMQVDANAFGSAYKAMHPDAAPDEVLQHVEAKIKRVYPEKFKNPARERAAAVEGGSSPKKAVDSFQLTEHEERAMKAFVRTGVMTKEQYIAEVKKTRGA